MVDEYRKLTAEMTGADIKKWFPDLLHFQMEQVWDILEDRGWVRTVYAFPYEYHIYLVHDFQAVAADIFCGEADTEEKAFMQAFMKTTY